MSPSPQRHLPPRRASVIALVIALAACRTRLPDDSAPAGGPLPPDLAAFGDARLGCQSDGDCPAWQYCERPQCLDWTPSRMRGLALWLDPDHGLRLEGDQALSWRDASPHQHLALALGSGPILRQQSALAGHAALRFDGQSYLAVLDAPSLQFGRGAFVVEVVARYQNPPNTGKDDYGYAMLYLKANTAWPFVGAGLFGNTNYAWLGCGAPVPSRTGLVAQVKTCLAAGSVGTPADNDGRWHAFGMRRRADGVTLEARSDGTRAAAGTVPLEDVSAPGFFVEIGGRATGPQQLIGDIAEVVTAADNDDDGELRHLEGYLAHKYGL